MEPTLRTAIIEILTDYLKRPPSEDEIINAQTDLITMGKVRDRQIADIQSRLDLQGGILNI